jgi:hypothetical protein
MTRTILIDGSNVLFWKGGQAQVDVPERVVRALVARRFAPVVYFDNSIGRHIGQGELAVLGALAEVITAPAGTPADALLLKACAQGRHQIVSNDRFRMWRGTHPALQARWLVTGSIGKGRRVSFSKKLIPAPL